MQWPLREGLSFSNLALGTRLSLLKCGYTAEPNSHLPKSYKDEVFAMNLSSPHSILGIFNTAMVGWGRGTGGEAGGGLG